MASVTVIIPTYNHAKYLPEALDSVLNQTYHASEVIVVDDGSTDNTKEVLAPYWDKIKYIYQQNGKQAKARNTGIRASAGEYVAFLDADDAWMPEKLEIQVKLLDQKTDIGLVFADAELFEGHTTKEGSLWAARGVRGELLRNPNGVADAFQKLLEKNFIPTGSVVVRRECFNAVGLFDESLPPVEDKDMWLRIARQFKIDFTPQVLVRKRGYSTRDLELLKRQVLRVLDKMEACYPEDIAVMEGSLKRARARIHGDLAAYYWDRGDLTRARGECVASLRHEITLRVLTTAVKTMLGKRAKWIVRWIKGLAS